MKRLCFFLVISFVFLGTAAIADNPSGDSSSTEFALFDFHCHTLYGSTTDELYDILYTNNEIIGCALFPGFYGDEEENFTDLHFDEILSAAEEYPEFFYPFAEIPRDPKSPYQLILELEVTDRMRDLDLDETPSEIKDQLALEGAKELLCFMGSAKFVSNIILFL